MLAPGSHSFGRRLTRSVLAGASALICSLWIAICAAAPELIWQGLRVALAHPSWADLASALLIGLILAFFIEPITERARDILRRAPPSHSADGEPPNVVFTATLSLAFAVTSVCLHDAMSAFVSGHGAAPAPAESGLAAAITLIAGWAIVPFAVTLAWLSVPRRWLAIPMAFIASASGSIAGWAFSWSNAAVVSTTIPSLLILGFGYQQIVTGPRQRMFVRCARTVALAAGAWLTGALLLGSVFKLSHLDRFVLYDSSLFWIDVRFYLGWTLGLLLVPVPYYRAADD